MTVEELIKRLSGLPPEAKVFMGYDGNIVVTEPAAVTVSDEDKPGCWWRVKRGDVVILCAE